MQPDQMVMRIPLELEQIIITLQPLIPGVPVPDSLDNT